MSIASDDGDSDSGAAELEDREVAFEATELARLDAAIAANVPELSRVAAQRLIDDGRVTVEGAVVRKAGTRLHVGDRIAVAIPAAEPLEVIAEAIPLAVVYEDSDLIVIDKPAGLVVHPAAGHPRGTVVNALLAHCTDLSGIGGVLRPGIVHRLDKDTSGLLVAAKSDRAHIALSAAFAARTSGEDPAGIARSYLALTSPKPPRATGTLRTLYGRHPTDRKRFSSKVRAGKAAVTHWRVDRVFADGAAALVEFRLETGRTHQIRVHAADHGFALLADAVYGTRIRDPRVAAAADSIGRQALHAASLAFRHPVTGAALAFTAPPPADFQRALGRLAAS